MAPLGKVKNLIRKRGGPAQLCVLHRGRVVLDETVACRPDSLFFLFSASKPLVALLVHLLAQRGELALDDPVATYWPAFGQHGKHTVTIRQVLQHRSGIPVARSFARDALVMTDWDASVRALERATPRYPPGQVPAYHILSYGFILGEVVRRVSGVPAREFLARELLEPLGLHDIHLGLPPELWARHVPVAGSGPAELITQLAVNRRATRQAVVPAASVSATARDLARLYQALLDWRQPEGAVVPGVGLLRPGTIDAATTPSSDGEMDRFLHLPIRWSQGFQLGGERQFAVPAGRRPDPLGMLASYVASGRSGRYISPLGTRSSSTTFGHNGSYVCIGWADPERQLAVGYVTARLASRPAGTTHMTAVNDAILAEFS
jgi:CubicO group peptidase (beta-lactamase class C family)